jgi:hypothetical protein
MEEVYYILRENSYVETAEDFSTEWCWRSKNWFAVQKNKKAEFSIPVAINCLNTTKMKIALAHLKRKRLGSIADSDIQILGSIRDALEQHLLDQHRIAAVAEAELTSGNVR